MDIEYHHTRVKACHHCGQVLRMPVLQKGEQAVCFRCRSNLAPGRSDAVDRTLALALTSLILFIAANAYPFLGVRVQGAIQETSLMTGIFSLYDQGMSGLATLVFLTIIILPLIQTFGLIYLYLPVKLGRLPWKSAMVFRCINRLKPWGMMEIYLLGILISMVKLAKMATIIPGIASGAFFLLICTLTAALSGLNPDDIWKRLPVHMPGEEGGNKIKGRWADCHSCALLCRIPSARGQFYCPRCQAGLHIRKPNSITRTWALVIAAGCLYVPANIFPVTFTRVLGDVQADTILSGVIYFLFSGSWHIALVIFVASVIVPLMKLIILVYLLISVHMKSAWKPEDRTRLYRVTEAVGRWSMVDVYVVTILVALVQLGPVATITAGPGVIYFAAVVVITMFASESFDPRLIWDNIEALDESK